MKARAAARFAGGRGMAFAIQAYVCFRSEELSGGDEQPCTYGTVHCEDKHHEEEGKVAGAIVCCKHEDETAHKHDGNRVEEEPETVADLITEVGVGERPDHNEDIRRRCKK